MESEKFGNKIKEAKKDVLKRTFSYIAAGLGLVIGLAWNEAITSLINAIFPDPTNTIIAKFVYAVVITLAIGLTLFYVEKLIKRNDAE